MFGSLSQKGTKTDADGLFGNKCSQNLWVYTADCCQYSLQIKGQEM